MLPLIIVFYWLSLLECSFFKCCLSLIMVHFYFTTWPKTGSLDRVICIRLFTDNSQYSAISFFRRITTFFSSYFHYVSYYTYDYTYEQVNQSWRLYFVTLLISWHKAHWVQVDIPTGQWGHCSERFLFQKVSFWRLLFRTSLFRAVAIPKRF